MGRLNITGESSNNLRWIEVSKHQQEKTVTEGTAYAKALTWSKFCWFKELKRGSRNWRGSIANLPGEGQVRQHEATGEVLYLKNMRRPQSCWY